MVESKMTELKMAAIIRLSQNEWQKFLFVQMVGTNLGKCEWIWEEILRFKNARRWNLTWQNSRWLPSSSWVRMNEFESDWISLSQIFVQNGWIQDDRIQDGHHHQVDSEWMSEVFLVQDGWMQDGRIQDGCHHQIEWEWMSLSQIEFFESEFCAKWLYVRW